MTNYEATPDQWEFLENSQVLNKSFTTCILELRSRVELLESTLYYMRCKNQRLVNAVASFAPNRMEFFAALHPDIHEEVSLQHQTQAALHDNSQLTPNNRQIRSSDHQEKLDSLLVERVAVALSRCEDLACWDDEAVNWTPEARAAIREVAEWLQSNHLWEAADVLEQEVER